MQCRSLRTLLSLLGLLLFGVGDRPPSYAHGGGLNANGCHSNRKTGSYHCHGQRSGPSSVGSLDSALLSGRVNARVVSVGDGDTIRVSASGQNITVRLACIDAPEMAQTPYGVQARDQLRALIPRGTSVLLAVQTTDRYGRSVAEIFKGSQNINQSLVSSGAAFVYWKYIAKCDRTSYALAETQASTSGRGIWSDAGEFLRPWVYRRTR